MLAEGTLDCQYTRFRSGSSMILFDPASIALVAGAWFGLKRFTAQRVAG
ncbi:hypothetical protein RE6C_02184 [Rhodopirellula europaea 6C]|uniref:Uncharacterized protein n=1 Tax=Rhodopirellula europaea 6C TaxID=1263867 RepID=M2B5S4_9BACT|nr:hypothetical protein RE6C_02184 [Rhodopirellula europaea 6C]